MICPRSMLAAVVACFWLTVCASTAEADVFGPITLASESAFPCACLHQQADYVHDPVISGNGQYVAFDGSFGGRSGVWRRDLATGEVEQVAGADAALPSISQEGRYVSFTTTERLARLDDTNERGPDVYVRDMNIDPSAIANAESAQESPACERAETAQGSQETDICPFTLVSAVGGRAEGLRYSYGSAPSEDGLYGSRASGRSAMSADGRSVVFVTTAVSDLAGEGTSELQVAVRNLDTRETRLVSVSGGSTSEAVMSQAYGGESFGAVYHTKGTLPFLSPPGYSLSPSLGASISADGTTVAWLGQDVGEQVHTLPGEIPRPNYAEPLWRRFEEGPTRRITGGSDSENPACVASGERALPPTPSAADPCQGPFAATAAAEGLGVWTGEAANEADLVPQLSADGYTVAFVANAPLVSLGADFGADATNRSSDLYAADMHQGLARDQALHPLTELASGNTAESSSNSPIVDFGISADGSQVAFSTRRTIFPLGLPAYISAPAAEAGMAELYDADLADGTLTRVTQGFQGGASERPHIVSTTGVDTYGVSDGALSPSFSANGALLAFSSTASNLVFGDGNTPVGEVGGPTDGADAFVVPRVLFTPEPTPQEISSTPAPEALSPVWRLGLTASTREDGSVLLEASVPGAGSLRVAGRGAVLQRLASPRHVRRGRGKAIHFGVAMRFVTYGNLNAGNAEGGLVPMRLSLTPRYRALAARRGGLSVTLTAVFHAPGHPALSQKLLVTFARKPHAPHHQLLTRR